MYVVSLQENKKKNAYLVMKHSKHFEKKEIWCTKVTSKKGEGEGVFLRIFNWDNTTITYSYKYIYIPRGEKMYVYLFMHICRLNKMHAPE